MTKQLLIATAAQLTALSQFQQDHKAHGAASFFGLMAGQSEAAKTTLSGACHGALRNYPHGLSLIGSAFITDVYTGWDKAFLPKVRAFLDWWINRSVFSAAFDVGYPDRQTVDNIMQNGVFVRCDIDSRIMVGALQGTRYPYYRRECIELWYYLHVQNDINPMYAFWLTTVFGYGSVMVASYDHQPVCASITVAGMYNLLRGTIVTTKRSFAENRDYNYIFNLWDKGDTYRNNGKVVGSYLFELFKRYPDLIQTDYATDQRFSGATLKPAGSKRYTHEEILVFAAQENALWDTWVVGSVKDIPILPFDEGYFKSLPYRGVIKYRPHFDWSYYTISELLQIIPDYFHGVLEIPKEAKTGKKALQAFIEAEFDRRPNEFYPKGF